MKSPEDILPPDFVERVAGLYHDMEAAYDEVASALDFSCNGCPDNCCDSYFQHHTYTEWAYLWHGIARLSTNQLESITESAAQYVTDSEAALARGERPLLMCPLNSKGRCSLYPYRLMICRLHGVPAAFTRPDGREMEFPGCFRCQEHVARVHDARTLDRTPFYRRLVELETRLLGPGRMIRPRLRLTIAQMIIMGPPELPVFNP